LRSGFDDILAGGDSFLTNRISQFKPEYEAFDSALVLNGWFEEVDFELYYAMVRMFCPKRIIEIGGGNSTVASDLAARRNGNGSFITVIDPEPRRVLPDGVVHKPKRVQEVDVALFDQLERRDILFIDSSHTAKEASYHLDKILPRLASGVAIHHHDIMYPYEASYGEEGVVLRFYADHANEYKVLCAAAFEKASNDDVLKDVFTSCRRRPDRIPGSLWTVKQ